MIQDKELMELPSRLEKQEDNSPDSGPENDITDNNEGPQRTGFRAKLAEFLNYVGPGFLISIACLDPGNLAGDIAVGQQTRFRLFWVLVLAHILCYLYQNLALRIGIFFPKKRLCFKTRYLHSLPVLLQQPYIKNTLGNGRACPYSF